MVRVIRVNLSRCKFTGDTKKQTRQCQKILQVFVDGAENSELFQSDKWDGYYKFYDRNNFFDFGLLDELVYHLKEKKIKFRFDDLYKKDSVKFSVDKRMFPYQKKAIKKFYKKDIGIIKVPPRGGKTFIAAELSRITIENNEKETILFVVDTTDLFNQAIKDISDYLRVDPSEIGTINSRKQIFKKVNVGMAQSMVSIFYGKTRNREKIRILNKFLINLKFLIVDEVHANCSDKRINLFNKCKNVKWKLGLSGTPFTQFGIKQNMIIKGNFGGVVFDIPKSELQDGGYLSMDKVFLIHVDHSKTKYARLKNYQEFLKHHIHENEYRNSLLMEIISQCVAKKWKTLVLFSSKQHGYLISKEMNLPFISGDDKTDVRESERIEFLEGKGKVLLASNIYKKGITLPEAEVLIIGDGGLEGSNLTQKYSRVLGITNDKPTSAIIDLMDTGVDYFRLHSLNRLNIYTEEMQDRIEVYNDFEIPSMTESIEEWLHN